MSPPSKPLRTSSMRSLACRTPSFKEAISDAPQYTIAPISLEGRGGPFNYPSDVNQQGSGFSSFRGQSPDKNKNMNHCDDPNDETPSSILVSTARSSSRSGTSPRKKTVRFDAPASQEDGNSENNH